MTETLLTNFFILGSEVAEENGYGGKALNSFLLDDKIDIISIDRDLDNSAVRVVFKRPKMTLEDLFEGFEEEQQEDTKDSEKTSQTPHDYGTPVDWAKELKNSVIASIDEKVIGAELAKKSEMTQEDFNNILNGFNDNESWTNTQKRLASWEIIEKYPTFLFGVKVESSGIPLKLYMFNDFEGERGFQALPYSFLQTNPEQRDVYKTEMTWEDLEDFNIDSQYRLDFTKLTPFSIDFKSPIKPKKSIMHFEGQEYEEVPDCLPQDVLVGDIIGVTSITSYLNDWTGLEYCRVEGVEESGDSHFITLDREPFESGQNELDLSDFSDTFDKVYRLKK